MTDQAMIFAAGEGRRMRPLTLTTPKPLLEVQGKPLIVWWLERLAALGLHKLVINTSHLGEQVIEALGTGERWKLEIHYSPEPSPLETGGGLLQALPQLDPAPFLLVNADAWCPEPPPLKLAEGQLAQLLLVPNPDHNPSGDFYLNQNTGQLRTSTQLGYQALTFAGISLLHPDCLAPQHLQAALGFLPEPGSAFALAPLLRYLIDQGLASGQLHQGEWLDVGTPERLASLQGQSR